MLLSRVADHLYWGSRYLERAEDTARVVRSFTEVLLDLPAGVATSWEPLLAIVGGRDAFDAHHTQVNERNIVHFLVADSGNPGSVVSSIAQARENLRTTREVLPREGWQAVNDLYLFSGREPEAGVDRRSRSRFLSRVIDECRQLDGVLSGCMLRDEAYSMWRLGEAIERADMTTRVLGVRAAALLTATGMAADYDEVQWMGVLRSVSGLQMYQRSTRGPIDGAAVVRFLVLDPAFPRSVAACVGRMREAFAHLPRPELTAEALDELDALVAAVPAVADDGAALDDAMDAVQVALARLNDTVHATFVAAE